MDKRDIYHLPAANVEPWSRTLCSVLEEMRKCFETRNFSPLHGLIEEAQTYLPENPHGRLCCYPRYPNNPPIPASSFCAPLGT